MARTEKRQRKILAFQACHPILMMVENETKGKAFGTKSRVLQGLVAQGLGPKYPKLWEEFRALYHPVL